MSRVRAVMKMLSRSILLLAIGPALCLWQHRAEASGVGQRFSLTTALQLAANQSAQVFVPDYYAAQTNGRFLLVFHIHGAVSRSEDIVYRARANAIVLGLQLDGLSGVYQSYFADQTKFPLITNLVLEVLRTNNIIANPQIDKFVLTSFSAGYAGIREILKVPANYERTDALLLGDTLYSSSDPATRTAQMRDFLQFAADARDGGKTFLLTHSSVATPGYDSTVQTADYLVSGIGRSWTPVSAADAIGTQYRQCDAGQFQAKGYLGNAGSDHTSHFLNMHIMMERWMSMIGSNQIHQPVRFKSSAIWGSSLELQVEGNAGGDYFLERSENLVDWAPASVFELNANPVTIVDTLAPVAKRFYRARLGMGHVITTFDSYAAGASVMFQPPSYSGSTLGFIESGAPAVGYVTNVFPASGQNGARVVQATWSFKSGQAGQWIRLTTFNAPNLPNPTISLTGALRFDIHSSKDIYVALGIRETATTAPIGANGGISGGIEWVGCSTENSSPPKGHFVTANTWTRLTFHIPVEPVGNFVGDGVLFSVTGKGTLEHLAIVPAQEGGAHTLYLDNFHVID